MSEKLYVIAGDCGVYVGWVVGEIGERVVLRGARHLRRYYVAGRVGDGAASDLAVLGLCPESPSIGLRVEGETILLGVRRAFEVGVGVATSFGCE